MDIKIVNANINAEISKSPLLTFKEELLIDSFKTIKNYETIQDMIDGSPTAECPVCMDVTFTESTNFMFKLNCNHLLCVSCATLLDKYNTANRLVNITFMLKMCNVYPFLFYSG